MDPSKAATRFMMPYAMGATFLLGFSTILELASKGSIASPDRASRIYLTLMGAYAGAGELKGWLHKVPPEESDEVNPWLDHARKGGLFVAFWVLLYAAAYIIRLFERAYPMPHELESVTLEIIGLFFVTFSARSLRRVRLAGAGSGGRDDAGSDASETLTAFLKTRPEGTTIREIEEKFPDATRRSLNRLIAGLIEEKQIVRDGAPQAAGTRYRPIDSKKV